MSISYWLDQKHLNPENHSFDITIVGAGIAGVSTAYWLKKEDPSLSICLIDKGSLGAGATGRNAGFITCGSVEHFNRLVELHGKEKAFSIWKFSEDNLSLLKEEIIQDQAAKLDFSQGGTFSLASDEKEFSELKKTAQLMEEMNIAVETVDGKNIQERVGGEGFVGGIKYIDDACVHPVKLIQHILGKSQAQFFEYTELMRVEATHEGTRKLITSKGNIETSIVVYAGNGYLPTLNSYFADKVYPTRGQIMMTEPIPVFMEAPCYAHFVLDYFRQLPTGELLIGGFRQLEKTTEVGYSDHVTETIQEALLEFTKKHLPKFADCKITHRWAGVMGFSKDGQQMIGALPEDPQVYFIGGFTAHGLGLAFNTGKSLVDLMFDREAPDFIQARRFN